MSFSMLYFSIAWVAQSTASCCISSVMSAFFMTALRSDIYEKVSGPVSYKMTGPSGGAYLGDRVRSSSVRVYVEGEGERLVKMGAVRWGRTGRTVALWAAPGGNLAVRRGSVGWVGCLVRCSSVFSSSTDVAHSFPCWLSCTGKFRCRDNFVVAV